MCDPLGATPYEELNGSPITVYDELLEARNCIASLEAEVKQTEDYCSEIAVALENELAWRLAAEKERDERLTLEESSTIAAKYDAERKRAEAAEVEVERMPKIRLVSKLDLIYQVAALKAENGRSSEREQWWHERETQWEMAKQQAEAEVYSLKRWQSFAREQMSDFALREVDRRHREESGG